MNFSEPFIRRPVATTLLMLSFLLFGALAFLRLPVSDLPNVDFPTIQVSASLPGASPETMASAVATVLERQFSTIAGIDSMSSSSIQGSTQITLQFALDRNIDAAAQDVQAAISRAARQLPPDLPAPPSYQKVNPADSPILFIALTSPTVPMSTLNEYGETMMAQRISMVNGVAQVQVYGAQKFAVRVQADPAALAARGIGLDEVAEAIRRGNVNLPTGVLQGPHRALNVQTDGQLLHADAYRPLIVTYRNGAPVRLGEIAHVFDGVENDRTAAWFCTPEAQQRTVMLAIQRQPGANTVEVADAVKALLPEFENRLPASVSLAQLNDRSLPIRASFEDTIFTLGLTLVLVVLVIFLFLRSWSATAIPSLALPLSLIGTFAFMHLFHYSLDNISLMALTLAIGFVVDDAIVMLENVVRHMEMGKDRLTAALDGSREIGFTIISMTLALVAVFIPVLFMGGIVGRLFQEFAVTIAVSVLISGVVSLTLTPLLCALFLRPTAGVRHGRLYDAVERGFQRALAGYDRSLAWVLRHRRVTLAFSAACVALTFWVFERVPKGFLPSEDRNQLQVRTEAAEGISYPAMFERQQALAAVVQRNTNVVRFISSAGARNESGGNTGRMFLLLKPRHQRTETADQVAQQLRAAMARVPGIRAFVLNPPVVQIGARFSKSLYQYTIAGPDPDELYAAAGRLEARLAALPQFQDVTSDMQFKNPEVEVRIDRDRASALGLTAEQIESALQSAYGSRQVSTIFAPNNQYAVILELRPEYQREADALALLHVRSSTGRLVPLRAVAELHEGIGPLSVTHSGQLPSVTLSFNLPPGVSVGDAVRVIEAEARTLIPPTLATSFQGTAQAFQSSFKGLGMLLLLAVLVIYMVLGVLYESFLHPITILSALPFAGLGALLALWIFKAELSLYAFVGIIMLIGLVKKNGIMMVDFAIEARRDGTLTPVAAIHRACMVRFRPILMTALSTLVAGIPIAVGFGAGGEARRPLGLAVVGGMLFSQTLTLFVTPVFYVYIDRLQTWLARRRTPRAAVAASLLALFCAGVAGTAGAAETPAVPAVVPAEGPLRLTVTDAVLLALRNHPSVAAERMNPDVLRTFEREERAAFDPALSGELSRQESDSVRLLQSGTGTINSRNESTTGAVTLGAALPTGTHLALEGSGSDTGLNALSLASARLGFSITQPLLQGFGSKVNLVRLRQARLDVTAAEYEFRGFLEAFVAQVERTCYDHALAVRAIAIVRESLRLAEQQRDDTAERIRIGRLAQVEQVAAEAEVALRREALINAESARDTVRLKLVRFLNLAGGGWDRELLIEPPLDQDAGRPDPVADHVRAARRDRPELNQARIGLQRQELELVRTRNGLLPKMDAFVALGDTGYADSFGGTFGGEMDRGNDWQAGVRFEYPLGDRRGKAQHTRANLTREQQRLALDNLRQLVELDVRTGYVEYERQRAQVEATRSSVRLMEEKLRAENEKFRVGMSTSLLVAQAQRDVLSGQVDAAVAVAGSFKALIDLYRFDGSLLRRRGFEAPGEESAPEPTP